MCSDQTEAGRGAHSPWVRRFAHLVTAGGEVLDVAAGGGRHSRFFLDRGCRVTAVDRDVDGLADLADRGDVEVVAHDLEDGGNWPFPGRRFDCVVVANYLYRPLLPVLAQSLTPGGVLLYETFAVGNERYGRPRRADFLLQPGELWRAFADELQIIAYEHGYEAEPREAVRQRIAAVAASEPRPLAAP
ncbi:MAG: class I SAM-dependent methyltransferase [Alphaproteobacteria bacterium]|nr:class I SAM-dependent methyltransferase [Alphaproteobacteria bacterium]